MGSTGLIRQSQTVAKNGELCLKAVVDPECETEAPVHLWRATISFSSHGESWVTELQFDPGK